MSFFAPDWPAPNKVQALQSTRQGGVSRAAWASLNFAFHVGDDRLSVGSNRQRLQTHLPTEVQWLQQVHGSRIVELPDTSTESPKADASFTSQRNVVCAVQTADCLPLLICDRAATVVAAVHAGWRGLSAGVIESTLARLAIPANELLVWLGPAIGQQAFEVGEDVYTAFVDADSETGAAFVRHQHKAEKWLCDVYALARRKLECFGVTFIYGGGECTFSDIRRYYSFRRDGVTGRMASLIWLAPD